VTGATEAGTEATRPRAEYRGLPEPDVRGDAFLRNALLFSRALRSAGLAADLAAVLDFARSLELVDIGQREQVHTAGEALFVRRREDLEPYDIIFERFWRRHNEQLSEQDTQVVAQPDAPESGGASEGQRGGEEKTSSDAGGEDEPQQEALTLAISPEAYSAAEAFSHRDFDRMSAAELREAARIIDRMVPALEQRQSRRWELHAHGRLPAPRQLFRRNLATGGNALTWLWRRKVRRPRQVVLICDVSGSMERHSRLLLRFAQALIRSRVRTEAFVFGTHLTRVSRQLRGRDPDLALTRAAAVVTDWSGGTRIGASFREFNQHWARRTLRSSGVVVVVSDGWDRGSAELVGEETERLRRNCHRLIWLNPLAGAPDYRPLAAGMAAAYPHIDDFLPANDLASLERLAEVLGRQGVRPRATGFGAAEAGVSRPVGPGRTSPPLVSPYPLPSDGAA
jgi:uncharacterized protein with von Willebrand factor type A (vWA) domain